MRRIIYIAVLAVAVAALGATVYAQAADEPAFKSAVLDRTTGSLVISFDKNIDILALDGAKLHIRERGSDTGGVMLDGVMADRKGAAYEFSSRFGGGSGPYQFNNPSGIEIDGTGHMFIADRNNNRIQIFNSSGILVNSLNRTGMFAAPWDVAIDSTGKIIVSENDGTDGVTKRIQILRPDGTSIRNVTENLESPRHLAINSSGYIFVADRSGNNGRVQIFDSKGDYEGSIRSGPFAGPFIPVGVEIDSRDRILVTGGSAPNSYGVAIFDSSGNHLDTFGETTGDKSGQFLDTFGLITYDERIFISDNRNARIQIFDLDGKYLDKFSLEEDSSDQPHDIAFDKYGRAVVAEINSHTIQTFVPVTDRLSIELDADMLSKIGENPVLDIGAGAVRTVTGASIAESTDNHLAVRGEPPRLDLVTLDDMGDLTMHFDQVNPFSAVPSKLHIRDANRTGDGMTLTADYTLIDDRYDFGSYFATNVTHGIRAPSDMAVAPDGGVIVADSDNHCIRIFEPDGTIKEIGKDNTCGPDSDGDGDGQFNGTRGVAVNSTGHIFVADRNNHRIQILNSSGDYLHKFGSPGDGDEQFRWPGGITIDSTGRIIVSDTWNHRIVIYNPDYSFDRKFGELGGRHGEFRQPAAVAVNSTDHIFVTDPGAHRISMFNSTGHNIGVIGTQRTIFIDPGSGEVEFNFPEGIEIDSNDKIYVADSRNHRVQVLDSDNSYITQFGSEGNSTGEFKNPRGVAVHGDDILVADTGNNRIQRFVPGTDDTSRQIIHNVAVLFDSIGSGGQAPREFNEPSAVAIDSTGRIAVADSRNHRVQILDPDGMHNMTIGGGSENEEAGNSAVGFFAWPRGIAMNDTHVFVTDANTDRVQIFDHVGKFAGNITTPGKDHLDGPHGLDIDHDGRIFVAARSNHTVQIFNSDGDHTGTINGSSTGGFDGPEGVAVGSDLIAIADTNNHRIVIFNSTDLSHVNTFGTQGDGEMEFNKPRGMAIDSIGRIWVADTDNNRIKVHDPTGNTVNTFGTQGDGDMEFNRPRDVAIDHLGRAWVADTGVAGGGNYRIQVFAFPSDDVTFRLLPQALHAAISMDIPVLDIDAGAVTDLESDMIEESTDNPILTDSTPPVLSSVRVVPASGTIGYGGSLYIEFESEPGLSIHPDSTINDRPVGTDALSYFDGTYSVRYTVSKGDNNVTADALPAFIVVSDAARNDAFIYGQNVGSTPAINSSLPATFELLDSSFRLDTSAITLRFNANVSVSDVLTLQIRDTDGTELNLLSDGVELSLPDDSDYTFTRTIDSNDIADSGFNEPSDIAINSTGHMFVTDTKNHRILVFGPDRMHVASIGNTAADGSPVEGTGQEHFKEPRGIAVNGTDYILVADTANHRLQVLYPNGSYANHVGKTDSAGTPTTDTSTEGFDSPYDVAVNGTDHMFVVGKFSDRFWVLGPDTENRRLVPHAGGDKSLFGPPGGDLNGPQGVTASGGRVFIADTHNDRIRVFGSGDAIERTFGANGLGQGNFTDPRGMAVDGMGRIWVAEAGANDRLQLVTPDGDHVMYLGVDELTNPHGVAYDRYRVFAADTGGDRVLVYEPLVSEFRFALSGEAREIVSRMVSPSVHVDVTVSNPDGLALKERYVVAGYVPTPDDDSDSRVTVDVAVPELQDRSLVTRGGGGGSSIIITDTPIVQSPGEATSVLHSINWETSNDMITLYVVTSAPDGSEPYVYLRTPDSGTITAKVSDSQPYPGRILYEVEISASNNFAQVYVDDVSQYILLDAPKGNVPVTLYDSDTSLVEPAMDPVITEPIPEPVIEPETPADPEPPSAENTSMMQDDPVQNDPVQDAEPVQVVDPEPTDNEQITNDDINGCLIATAAYGTELAPQVQLLRELRDGSLLQTDSGTAFMGAFNNIYYAFSPEIADLQRENPIFREATKLLLTPMLYTLNIMSIADDEISVLGLGLSVIALNIGMYIISPAFAGYTIYKHRKNVLL